VEKGRSGTAESLKVIEILESEERRWPAAYRGYLGQGEKKTAFKSVLKKKMSPEGDRG